jgi:hypothetical protein
VSGKAGSFFVTPWPSWNPTPWRDINATEGNQRVLDDNALARLIDILGEQLTFAMTPTNTWRTPSSAGFVNAASTYSAYRMPICSAQATRRTWR